MSARGGYPLLRNSADTCHYYSECEINSEFPLSFLSRNNGNY